MRPDLKAPTSEILARFAAVMGEKGVLTAPDDTEPYLQEWRGLYHGLTPMVLRPQTVEQVSAILKLAHDERIAIVPQGGNTGLVGGQIPFEFGGEIVLSLNRMKAIRAVDPGRKYIDRGGRRNAAVNSRSRGRGGSAVSAQPCFRGHV